jgi:hypothetical protein
MMQFLADQIDQMDLALDQILMRDRNGDRVALMLIDNAVELTLHEFAVTKDYENPRFTARRQQNIKQDRIKAALGRNFEEKVRCAKEYDLISEEYASSIRIFHAIRNTAYHSGLRHEQILHSLAIHYFKVACAVVSAYEPMFWSSCSSDVISCRAMKYLGQPSFTQFVGLKDESRKIWSRMSGIVSTMPDSLISDLAKDVEENIETTDGHLDFIVEASPVKTTRKQTIIECQAWAVAFSEKGKAFAASRQPPPLVTVDQCINWIAENYPGLKRCDPIPSWEKRLKSLQSETNPHVALKKYFEFITQTEELRELISEHASQLDAEIQAQIDRIRGK